MKNLTKIIMRHLPPALTEDEFREVVDPLPAHKYFKFCRADKSLGVFGNTRVYIDFISVDALFQFKERFDDYVFVDSKGNESVALVEYAIYQKASFRQSSSEQGGKSASDKRSIDNRKGTILTDPDYVIFAEQLEKLRAGTADPASGGDATAGTASGQNAWEVNLEKIKAREKELEASNGVLKVTTPLIEFLCQKKLDEKKHIERRKEDERRRKERIEVERRRQAASRKKIAKQTPLPSVAEPDGDTAKDDSSSTKSGTPVSTAEDKTSIGDKAAGFKKPRPPSSGKARSINEARDSDYGTSSSSRSFSSRRGNRGGAGEVEKSWDEGGGGGPREFSRSRGYKGGASRGGRGGAVASSAEKSADDEGRWGRSHRDREGRTTEYTDDEEVRGRGGGGRGRRGGHRPDPYYDNDYNYDSRFDKPSSVAPRGGGGRGSSFKREIKRGGSGVRDTWTDDYGGGGGRGGGGRRDRDESWACDRDWDRDRDYNSRDDYDYGGSRRGSSRQDRDQERGYSGAARGGGSRSSRRGSGRPPAYSADKRDRGKPG